jgi:hypothetical protein
MAKRIKLFDFSDSMQATALRVLSKNEKDSIKITVYGSTESNDDIEFTYDIEFKNEETRDFTFDSMKKDLLFADVKEIIRASNIPMIISEFKIPQHY